MAKVDTVQQAVSDVADGAHTLQTKMEEKLTVLWNDLAHWQQDNQYIHSGYRPPSFSFYKSFASLSYLHNETVNIYSHLIGALLALCASGVVYSLLAPRYATATREDVYAFTCYFAGAVLCLGMSATYHTIQNHSHHVAIWGNKLDYLGIVALIWGSFVPVLYYGFIEEPELRRTYWTMVSFIAFPRKKGKRKGRKHRERERGKKKAKTNHKYPMFSHLDHNPRSSNLTCRHPPPPPHPRAPSLESPHVRPHGPLRHRPRRSCHPPLRARAHAPAYRPRLGPPTRCPVSPRRNHLRRARAREVAPRRLRRLGLQSPDFPCLGRVGSGEPSDGLGGRV